MSNLLKNPTAQKSRDRQLDVKIDLLPVTINGTGMDFFKINSGTPHLLQTFSWAYAVTALTYTVNASKQENTHTLPEPKLKDTLLQYFE